MVSAPFRVYVCYFLFALPTLPVVFVGRSKRFCAEDRSFLSEAGQLPFRVDTRFDLPLSLGLALVAMFTASVGSPLVCKFRGMSLCVHGQVCPGVLRSQAGQCHVGGSVARVFVVGFRFCPTVCCDGCCFSVLVCSVSLVLGPVSRESLYGLGKGISSQRSSTCAGPPGWFKLKPEVLQKQVGKLAEEYGALFVDVTLRDGFIVPQVEFVTGIKFLRFLKKERPRSVYP